MNEIMEGLINILSIGNILLLVVGMCLGLFVGSLPGLSTTMGLALLLPITFAMDPISGLVMLASLYVGSHYGGSIVAILIRTPGTPSAAAAILDGYPMTEKGQASKALGLSLTAAVIGSAMGGIVLLLIASVLGELALAIGPIQMFAVIVLGLTIIGSLSTGSAIKGVLSGMLGVLFSLIGMDQNTGTSRFTFGTLELFDGIDFVVGLIGLFAIPQALKLVEKNKDTRTADKIRGKMLPSWKTIKSIRFTSLRSGVLGIILGIIPGAGGETASW